MLLFYSIIDFIIKNKIKIGQDNYSYYITINKKYLYFISGTRQSTTVSSASNII